MNTLKTTLTFLIAVMAISISNAQFGVRAGVNLASLNTKIDLFGVSFSQETDKKLGAHIGVLYHKQVNEKFSIRPNLLFTMGGGKSTDDDFDETVTINLSYLNLPVDFIYSVPVGSNSIALMGGPYVGYLLSTSSSEGLSDEDGFKAIDFGLNFGIEYQINSFGVGLSYGLGLVNILSEEDAAGIEGFFEGAKINTKVISLFFTYRFNDTAGE